MISIDSKTINDYKEKKLPRGNQILGTFPTLENSEILIKGKNNILYCEPGVKLSGSGIYFFADNAVVYLGTSWHPYKLSLSLHNDTVFHMGQNNFINGKMQVILSEQHHCFIGDNGIFSADICIRNADPHLLYDCNTKQRVNPTRSVYLGDHVWIRQGCHILKGTQMDSGSVLGVGTVITQKTVPHNTLWAGNPATQVKTGVFWDNSVVHAWKEKETKLGENYDRYLESLDKEISPDAWIYSYSQTEELPFEDIESMLDSLNGSTAKHYYLIEMNKSKAKNRFVHSDELQDDSSKKKSGLFKRNK